MEKIYAIIERGSDGGYAIYSNDIDGLVSSGMDEDEAREAFYEVRKDQAEYYFSKTGVHPDWENAEVEFRYSLAAFFMAFPYINVSQFARNIGINPSLMRKYKMGLAKASDKQKALIQHQLDILTDKLQHVQFG